MGHGHMIINITVNMVVKIVIFRYISSFSVRAGENGTPVNFELNVQYRALSLPVTTG